MIKPTNLDIRDAACLHVVHILQHPTSRPTTRSTQDTMVNALKQILSPLPAGKCGKSTMHSTRWRHQVNTGKSGLEAEWVQALGALRSLRSEKKLSAETRPETHIVSNEENDQWIEHYVDRETTVARKRVQDAETEIMQEQEHMRNIGKARSTTTKPQTTFEEMMNAIGDSLSDLASSEDEQDGEDGDDDDEDTALGKLNKDDEPGWAMGIISKMVQHRMESFRQKQTRLHKLMQLGWGDAADYFRERDMKYRTTDLTVPADVTPQTDTTAATPSLTTFRELKQGLDNVSRRSQIPQVTSWPGSSQMRLDSE